MDCTSDRARRQRHTCRRADLPRADPHGPGRRSRYVVAPSHFMQMTEAHLKRESPHRAGRTVRAVFGVDGSRQMLGGRLVSRQGPWHHSNNTSEFQQAAILGNLPNLYTLISRGRVCGWRRGGPCVTIEPFPLLPLRTRRMLLVCTRNRESCNTIYFRKRTGESSTSRFEI
jgi:hypothetical protein